MNDQVKRPRGRPRPAETVQRDQAVLELLRHDGAQTRNQIAEKLGAEKVKVYLSLDRLRREGLVRTCTSAAPGSTVWTAEVNQPCP